MNHLVIKAIFAAAYTAVEYIPGEGAFCPVCLFILKRTVRGAVYSTEENGVRRCRCSMCGVSFKAVQKYFPTTEGAGKKPETVDAKAKKRQIRNRKR